MNENYTPVLQQLAAWENFDPSCLHIDGNAVFERKGDKLIGPVCQIGTNYWNVAETTAKVLAELKKR